MAYKEISVENDICLEELIAKSFGIGYFRFRKLLDNREIKVNGERIISECKLEKGDLVGIYLKTEEIQRDKAFKYEIVYEDENCLAAYKPQGILTTGGTNESLNPFALSKTESDNDKHYRTLGELSFEDALREKYPTVSAVHRLDRNTCGVVMLAKNKAAFDDFVKAFKDRRVNKVYRALVATAANERQPFDPDLGRNILNGVPTRVKVFLSKNPQNGFVSASKEFKPGYLDAVTEFRLIEERDGLILLEASPISGRTHQIRATLLCAGLFLVGDSKYGSNHVNRRFHIKRQLLACVSMQFSFPETSMLYPLNNKAVIRNVDLFAMLNRR